MLTSAHECRAGFCGPSSATASPRKHRFFAPGADLLHIRASAGWLQRPGSARISIVGSSAIRHLENFAVVMNLHELATVGRRPTGRRERRWLKRFAESPEDRRNGSRLGNEGDQPDVAAAVRALKGKLLPDPGPGLGPGDSRGLVAAGLAWGMNRMRLQYGCHTVAEVPLTALQWI